MLLVRSLIRSRRWWLQLASRVAVSFGLLASLPEFYLTLWPKAELPRGLILYSIAIVSVISSLSRSISRISLSRHFEHPTVSIEIKIGDLFDEPHHLVIGFNDVFDTDSSDGVVISPLSVQGQFQNRIYENDTGQLNRDLGTALTGRPIVSRESSTDKPRGKLDRYEIGTVAVLGEPNRRFFCLAYGRMRNDLTVRSSADDLWKSLGRLWRSIDTFAQRKPVAIPIIGSEMARINQLDREVLLRMILLSFMAQSRQDLVCERLIILIHPKDAHLVNIAELRAFLNVL